MNNRLPSDNTSRSGWDKQHKRTGAIPLAWVFTADRLLRGFLLLAEQAKADVPELQKNGFYAPNISAVAMMLGALSIENLLKAICIKKLSPPFTDRGKFSLNTHDLHKLANLADIEFTKEENVLLERLTHFISWSGRYPIPLLSEGMLPRVYPSGEAYPLNIIKVPADFVEVMDFAKKIRKLIPDSDVPYEEWAGKA